MSKIILDIIDFSTIPTPLAGKFVIGVDIDGLPKLLSSTQTMLLGITGSAILQYHSVSYSEFSVLISTSALQPGGVYYINDFQTNHYIQYTDSNGDGSSNDESVNTSSIEPLLVLATSLTTYDANVKSVLYPTDDIKWIHNVSDREHDYASSSGKGHIVWRKSEYGNERDYDFRNVVFRRWNDGTGTYSVLRKADAGAPLDYFDWYCMYDGVNNFNTKVGSPNDLLTYSYSLDNFIVSSASSFKNNKIDIGFGSYINSNSFNDNNIHLLKLSNFVNGNSIKNKSTEITNCNFNATFSFNDLDFVTYATFSGDFLYNDITNISSSTLGTSSYNNIKHIDNSNVEYLSNNIGYKLLNSNVYTISDNNFNIISYCTSSIINNNNFNTLSYCDSLTVSNNSIITMIGNSASSVVGNISTSIQNNKVNSTISYNKVNYIDSNIINGYINDNEGIVLSNNSGTLNIFNNNVNVIGTNSGTGSISYNNGSIILNNSNNGSINRNSFNKISYNTSKTINDNISTDINYNGCNDISENKVQNISYNYTGTYSNNNGIDIISNTVSTCDFNSVLKITSNIVTEISKNNGYLINSNYGITISNNIFNNILSNTFSYIFENDVNRIENNYILVVKKNTGNIISFNDGSTASSSIEGNTINLISNNSSIGTFSNNNVYIIQNNTTPIITSNNSNEIISNDISSVSLNSTRSIRDNVDNVNSGGLVYGNIGDSIQQNSDFSEIAFNRVSDIIGNTFSATEYSVAVATFSFSGTPSVGDIATISYSIYNQSLISSTSSAIGFIEQVYNLFPSNSFTATFSSTIFTLYAPTSTVSYEGASFSFSIQGTYSAYSNFFSNVVSLDDMSINASGYTGSSLAQYTVVIDTIGTPDKFLWIDSFGNSASNVSITGTGQTLSNSVVITFGATTGHDSGDVWSFDVSNGVSLFLATFSGTFSGEESVSYQSIISNTADYINNNSNCEIVNNIAIAIYDNTNINLITNNSIDEISGNSTFDKIQYNKGVKFIGITGSSTYIIKDTKNIDIEDSILYGNIKNHIFMDSFDGKFITPSTNMQTTTYSTVSKYLFDLDGFYEEVSNSGGLTYSTRIA